MSDLDGARSALAAVVSDTTTGAVMVTGFVAVIKAIEPDGSSSITTITDCDGSITEPLGLLTYGLERAKRHAWEENDDDDD